MAWLSQTGPALREGEDELSLKSEFAKYLAQGQSARQAAYTLFRNDTDATGARDFSRALQAVGWESDPFVQETAEAFKIDFASNEDEEPTETELKQFLFETAKMARRDGKYKDAIDAIGKIMEARQMIGKSVTNVNVDNRQVHNVMAIPNEMSIEEAKLYYQQKQAAKQASQLISANARAA